MQAPGESLLMQRVAGVSIALTTALLALGSTELFAQPATRPAKPTIAQFVFDFTVTNAPASDDPFAKLLAGATSTVELRDLQRRLKAAAEDKNLSAVFLAIDAPSMTWAQLHELLPYAKMLRESGKPVIAYADSISFGGYILARTAARELYVNDAGDVDIKGIMAQLTYLKGTLDMLGIHADMRHCGVAKGAAEPLTLTGPSEAVSANINALLDDYYGQMGRLLANALGKDLPAAMKLLDEGPYTARMAVQAGLIDGTKGRLEAIAAIKQAGGMDPVEFLTADYAVVKEKGLDFSNPFALFSALTSPRRDRAPTKPAVAIIYAHGAISLGESQPANPFMGGGGMGSKTIVSAIDKARRDPLIKAVVLHIDSPGGSATASEAIYEALVRLRGEKPLVVSIADVAASGGYYIACPAHEIFVQPNSVVGSIGVVYGKMVLRGLFDKIGMTTHTMTRGGPQVAMFDPMRPFSPEESRWLDAMGQEIYQTFQDRVLAHRGEKLKEFHNKIVGGKVFSGESGVANGLADRIGGLDQALERAAALAELEPGSYDVRTVPKPVSFMEEFIKALSGDTKSEPSDITLRRPAAMPAFLADSPKAKELLSMMALLSPEQAASIQRNLRMLDLLRQSPMLMASPFDLVLSRP